MNFRDIILTANANLRRSKLRTFLTISAVFMGAFTLMLTTGVGAGLKTYVSEQVNAVGAKDVFFVQAVQEGGDNPFSSSGPKEYNPNTQRTASAFGLGTLLQPKDIEKIRNTKGIKDVNPLYPDAPEYVTYKGKKYIASSSQSVEGFTLPLRAGRNVDANSPKYEVTLPPSYVEPLGFKNDQDAIGKTITFGYKDSQNKLFTMEATVVGVQKKTLISNNEFNVSISFARDSYQKMTAGLPKHQVEAYEAAFAKFDSSLSKDQLDALKKKLKDQKYEASTLQDQLGIITNVISGITAFLNIFAAIVLAAASFGIVNTLLMAVQERTREIGLMKALGMGRGKIFSLFSLEAVLIGFWGALFALGAVNVIGRFGSRLASRTIFKEFEGLHLFSFPAWPMIRVILLIMVIAFLAATIPARRASKLDPIDALRYE